MPPTPSLFEIQHASIEGELDMFHIFQLLHFFYLFLSFKNQVSNQSVNILK